ncbi:transcriptional regulator domain-containing protein [Phenylobacterium sp. 58.2.17]|uniref:transcriptional regulator domain-containing protein n=1 Tax=Phenylobacterium sp. 58.2.17 TaxID=2969306 RepID=UPI002263C887|nr:DUF6499 domain-containing protein [Phenylobacterium sp. 58.2.17]MCX7587297.1 DUF6499 domain-containing protein [Phenylobacterium sp. 58.2.17]
MTPDASRWRSSADYAYLDTLIASDLAWECLRRNPAYQQDYAQITQQATGDERAIQRLRSRWGLRFPGVPRRERQDRPGVLGARSRSGDRHPGALPAVDRRFLQHTGHR